MLQVLFVVMGIGPLSQTPRRSELTLEDHVKGKMWFLSLVYRYPLCGTFVKNSVYLSAAICELFVKLKTL